MLSFFFFALEKKGSNFWKIFINVIVDTFLLQITVFSLHRIDHWKMSSWQGGSRSNNNRKQVFNSICFVLRQILN
jgi:hypothetical protein